MTQIEKIYQEIEGRRMKTQEEVVRQHFVGPINLYRIYQEGYQDHELDDWAAFRREAAKDILCAILANGGQTDDNDNSFATSDECITFAVRMADKLIAKLKHNEQLG